MKTIFISAIVLSCQAGNHKIVYEAQELGTRNHIVHVSEQHYNKGDTILIVLEFPNN